VGLSSEDVVNHEFRQALRGYAIPEVDELLHRVADQLERAQADIRDLRLRLGRSEARLRAALETEATLRQQLQGDLAVPDGSGTTAPTASEQPT
jgi:DivIVA domain-containing protein